jgi:hypothetical protein
MNPRPWSIVLVVSITVAGGCRMVQNDGLNSIDPSVQPAGSSDPNDAGSTGLPNPPDGGSGPEAGVAPDVGIAPDVGTAGDAPPPADAAVAPSPDLAPPPGDTAPTLPPDAAPPPEPVNDPAGSCPQTPDLALCLRFEGEVKDESRYQLVATTANLGFQSGPAGKAVDLQGQSSLVVSPNPIFDTAAVTLEAWVHPRSLGRRVGVVTNGNNYGLVILPSGSAMCTGGGGYALTGDAVSPGRWTSITCTYDAEKVTQWIDGRKTAENLRTGPVRTGSVTGVGIGNDVEPDTRFDGLIDNVRVWLRVRTPGQICAGARGCM